MDYAIYETIDGGKPRPVHIFKQQDHNHRAVIAARKKLHDIFLRALSIHTICSVEASKYRIAYDHTTSANTRQRHHLYIAPHKPT